MNTIIRASSLPGYSDCPRKWAASVLDEEIEALGYNVTRGMPKSIGASVGTGTHAGVAHLLLHKMQHGVIGAQADAEAHAFEGFEEALREAEVLWDQVTPGMNDAQKQIQRMVRVYRETIAQDIKPVSIERKLQANIGHSFTLSGTSDVQALEPGRLRDTKTGKTSRTHYAQLGSYSLLARTAHPEQPIAELCTDFVARAPLREIQPLPVTEFYDIGVAEQAAVSTMDRIKADVAEFRRRVVEGGSPPEHAFLANPNSMLCDPKWCPAFGSSFCREHKQKGLTHAPQ